MQSVSRVLCLPLFFWFSFGCKVGADALHFEGFRVGVVCKSGSDSLGNVDDSHQHEMAAAHGGGDEGFDMP